MDNIKHTPRNGTIRIVGYSFSLGRVADALLAAKKRGVHLQIVLDGHSRAWSPSKRLDAALGSDPTRRDYLVLTKGSARGTRGVTHQKSWQFSKVGQTPYVTMVGSTNLTGYGTEVQYSDMYTYTNRKDVYDAFASVQSRQKFDTPLAGPLRHHGPGRTAPATSSRTRPPPPRRTRSSPGSTRCPRTRTPTSGSPSSPGTTPRHLDRQRARREEGGRSHRDRRGRRVGRHRREEHPDAGRHPDLPRRLHEQEAHPHQADARLLPGRDRSRTPASGPGRTTGPTSRSATRTPPSRSTTTWRPTTSTSASTTA